MPLLDKPPTSINRNIEKTASLETDDFDIQPMYEYVCCGKRKELRTWFYPEYLVCAIPECRRKVKPRLVSEPSQSPAKRAKLARQKLK